MAVNVACLLCTVCSSDDYDTGGSDVWIAYISLRNICLRNICLRYIRSPQQQINVKTVDLLLGPEAMLPCTYTYLVYHVSS